METKINHSSPFNGSVDWWKIMSRLHFFYDMLKEKFTLLTKNLASKKVVEFSRRSFL